VTEGTPDDAEDPEDPGDLEDPDGRAPGRRVAPVSRRNQLPPAEPGLKAMTAARQANGTAGSTYR
jgi:hypothetical protein